MNRTIKILVAEDDENIREGLLDALEMENYQVKGAVNGREALKYYTQWQPDLLILDVMMPHKSGYDCCREIRRGNPSIPIIMLTAKGEEIDKVVGLELGADDYITKPFGLRELMARISAVLRRSQNGLKRDEGLPKDELKFGKVKIDIKKMRGECYGKKTDFSQKEIEILKYFLSRPGEVVERNELLNAAWGPGYHGFTRTLDQHIVQLRKKIEKDSQDPKHILTVYGIGYRFEE